MVLPAAAVVAAAFVLTVPSIAGTCSPLFAAVVVVVANGAAFEFAVAASFSFVAVVAAAEDP